MSVNRWAAKRDGNEKPIRQALEAVGVQVWKVSGKNLPDLLCLFQGRWVPLAVKMPKGGLTEHERKGVRWPLVRTIHEAFTALGLHQAADAVDPHARSTGKPSTRA